MKNIALGTLAGIIMASTVSVVILRGQVQTTPAEREEIRDMSQEMAIANQKVDELAAKYTSQLQNSPEFKARAALQDVANRKVKALQDKCEKGGKVLSIDGQKVETYLRCVDKPAEKKPETKK